MSVFPVLQNKQMNCLLIDCQNTAIVFEKRMLCILVTFVSCIFAKNPGEIDKTGHKLYKELLIGLELECKYLSKSINFVHIWHVLKYFTLGLKI